MKTLKQLLCISLFIVSAAIAGFGCASIREAPTGIDPKLLQDNLVEDSEGGPVVAPTTPHQQQNSDKTGGGGHFGEEKYIWDNWK